MKYRTLTESYKQIVIGEDGHDQSANVKNQLTGLKRNAEQLLGQVKPDSKYPAWWVNKLVKANDYLDSAKDFLQNKVDQGQVENKEEEVEESSAAWAKSLETIAKKKQLDKISDKDKATLVKIAQMLAKEKK
jgi:hypothetical protein